MAAKTQTETEEQVELCTGAQQTLIRELYQETGYDIMRQFPLHEMNKVSKADAGCHIDMLIGYKRAQQNGNGSKINGWEKISYAMIYKLVWKRYTESGVYPSSGSIGFIERVHAEYLLFKEAADYSKEQTAKVAVK